MTSSSAARSESLRVVWADQGPFADIVPDCDETDGELAIPRLAPGCLARRGGRESDQG